MGLKNNCLNDFDTNELIISSSTEVLFLEELHDERNPLRLTLINGLRWVSDICARAADALEVV